MCKPQGQNHTSGNFRDYLRLAIPSSLLMWSEWWVYEIMSLLAGHCGVAALAAHVAVSQLLVLIFMVPNGLSSATASLVGNSIGAGNTSIARAAVFVSCTWIGVLFVLVSFLVFALRSQLAHLFSSDDEVDRFFMAICVPLCPFLLADALQTVLEGIIRGLGLQRAASRVKMATMVGVRLLGAYILSFPLRAGVVGIWWGGLMGMIITVAFYARIVWYADLHGIVSSARQRLQLDFTGETVAAIDGASSENLSLADISGKEVVEPGTNEGA